MIYQQKVDFQAHYLPKVYYDFLEEEGLYCPDGFPAPEWDEAWQQEAMTELCISYALLSISSPSVFTDNKFRSRELARKINEEGAQIVSHAPGNLGFLATLLLPLVHSSIFEARCCLDELHADGVGLMANYGGVYLGDRRLDELMAELDGRGALAVMHPTQPAVMVPDVNEEIPVPVFEYFVETTRAFLNMAQNDTFTTPNMLAFVVPAGDYEKEAALLTELESRGEIDHAVSLANTEAMDGCMLADKLTPRQFSELAGLDYEMAQVVYAAEQGDYGKLMGNIASYKVPLIDTVRTLAQSYYPDGNVYVAGDSTNEYDFQKSFARDNTVVSIVSILIVLVVLFTFLSAGMPVLLILVIQGSIWINFSIPAVLNQPLFFMSYLAVSSIQMGANIDYAIVIASRYQELKNTMSHRDAMIETLNFAFPTVITSGTILAVAGTLIGQMTSEAAIVGIGQSLGRGTIISMLFVLPQILLLGGGLADKTSISMPTAARTHQSRERVFVVGLVTGEISGTVSGLVRASVDGNVNLRVISGRIADGAAVSIPIFLGDFDGQGHKITGLRLTENCSEYGLFSRVESGASVRNLTVEGEAIPAGTQTDVGGIVGQMVPDITLRFSSGGLDELQTELNALQSLINRTLDEAQSASDSVTGAAGVWTLTLPADGEESHTIRWHVPADGGWKKAQTSTVGSYLCFALPSDSAQFAVVPAMHAAWQLWAAIAAALTAIAAVITLVIRKRRAKAAKRAQ